MDRELDDIIMSHKRNRSRNYRDDDPPRKDRRCCSSSYDDPPRKYRRSHDHYDEMKLEVEGSINCPGINCDHSRKSRNVKPIPGNFCLKSTLIKLLR